MTPIALPALFDLTAATGLADMLRPLTGEPATGDIALDGSGVERIGIAGLQVLLSAHATAVAAGHALVIGRPSEPLRAAARTAGAGFLLSDR